MTIRHLSIPFVVAGGIFIAGCNLHPAKNVLPASHRISEGTYVTKNSDKTSADLRKAEIPEDYSVRSEALARFATGLSLEINDKADDATEEFYKSALLKSDNQAFVLETARRLLQVDQNQKAIELLSKVTNRPSSGTTYAMLARAYLQSGATNQAIYAGQMAVKKNPDFLPSYQHLAEIYSQQSRADEALKILDQAGKQTKADAAFLINLAESYSRLARLKSNEAEIRPRIATVLERAIKLNPSNPALLQKLADLLNESGDREQTAKLYLQLLDKYADLPGFRDALREKLANVYLANRDKARAAEQLESIVRDNPTKYPQAYYVLGNLAFEQKDFSKAADFFRKVILINPNMEPAYYDLAGSLLNQEKSRDALEILQQAEEKFSRNFVNAFYQGLAYQKLEKYSDALRHFVEAELIAKTTEPKRLDHLFYFQLGACAERNHDFEQAEKFFEKSIELKPDEPETLNYLGYMLADRGMKLDRARELIEKALKIEPENPAYLDSLGWLLFKLKQPQQALDYLLKAAQKSEKPDPTVFDHIGDVYHVLNEPEKARTNWKRSYEIEPADAVKKKIGAL